MLHARVIRPPDRSARSSSPSTRRRSTRFPASRVVRVNDFLARRRRRRMGRRRRDARIEGARGRTARRSSAPAACATGCARGRSQSDETLVQNGDAQGGARRAREEACRRNISGRSSRTRRWDRRARSPTCATARRRSGRASQATHSFRETIARALGLPRDAVRVIYVDGSGCYGMNGHDDAAADAALLSRAAARPVRVQWSREDEHGWDPKGPPQMLVARRRASTPTASIVAWRTEMWLPKATANLPNMPLLGLEAAGIAQTPGISTGLISQNGNPPYAVPNQEVIVHWLASCAAAAVEHPRAGQDRQPVRGRELHRRARARGGPRSGRVPAGGHRPIRAGSRSCAAPPR